ncbi:MAG: ASKHA domain-containing protein [Desulfobacterales bacterium]|nr:ASKHA domain-containing protein [Desulfobacterales bacterium]
MTMKHTIRFEPFGRRIQAEDGTTIFQAALTNGIQLRADCGEKGTCGKCRVIVDNPDHLSPPGESEQKKLKNRDATHRLACQAQIHGDLLVTVPEKLLLRNEVHGKTGVKGDFSLDPAVERITLDGAALKAAGQGDILSQVAKTAKAMEKEGPLEFQRLDTLARFSCNEAYNGPVTLTRHNRRGITAVTPGHAPQSLGVAFDIGTTTIAAYLCDLNRGKVLTAKAAVNPQRQFGEDVISRIATVTEDPDRLQAMSRLAATAMDDLIAHCLEDQGLKLESLDEITLVGNTTMQHIICGLNPQTLGLSPYLPMTRRALSVTAGDIGLNLPSGLPVYVFPVISGFLGGDILAACLGDLSHTREETTLMIDIGTNGELMLCNGDDLWATSCATGPALEGAQISCGMRASSGAISLVWADQDSIAYETIGDATPAGICGSGIIDAMAALRRTGITRENGHFNPEASGVRVDEKGLGQAYTLPRSDVQIQLKDVRQVQLAKSALFVGINALIEKSGVEKVDRTILTGAFGAKFNWKNAMDIGMLPPRACEGRVISQENLAGSGSIMALMDHKYRREIESMAPRVKFLDLAADPSFVMAFAQATQFPPLDQ